MNLQYMKSAIIYYTSNREDEEFEKKIRQNILNVCGGIPIVSVSQKPINFGKNICVGEVGVNDDNLFRQVQIACQNSDADFVITAEADVIYPEDYFKFIPQSLDQIYRSDNVWILYTRKQGYYKKEYSEGGQIIGRKFYLSILKETLKDLPMWNPLLYKNGLCPQYADKRWSPNKIKNPFRKFGWKYFHTNPIISVKTINGLRNYGGRPLGSKKELPIWGNSEKLKQEFAIYENKL